MKKIILTITTCIFVIFTKSILAAPAKSASKTNYVRQELQRMIDANLMYKDRFHSVISEDLLQKQVPDATLVMCSDSRVDTNNITENPAGQLFVIRNIGNQVKTAYGSVEYGVNHLHTPLVLIMGHTECGAVKAAMGDFSQESENLRTELNTLEVNPKDTLTQNIIKNVNNQVKLAMDDFTTKIQSKDVVIVGMIYDLHNKFQLGNGTLVIVNINNETSPEAIANNEYIKGLKNVAILGVNTSMQQ